MGVGSQCTPLVWANGGHALPNQLDGMHAQTRLEDGRAGGKHYAADMLLASRRLHEPLHVKQTKQHVLRGSALTQLLALPGLPC